MFPAQSFAAKQGVELGRTGSGRRKVGFVAKSPTRETPIMVQIRPSPAKNANDTRSGFQARRDIVIELL